MVAEHHDLDPGTVKAIARVVVHDSAEAGAQGRPQGQSLRTFGQGNDVMKEVSTQATCPAAYCATHVRNETPGA